MEDLVLLRELIRTPDSNCFSFSINHVFSHLGFEELLECVITRAAPPCNPIAVALSLNLIGIKSITSCARAGRDVVGFCKWYTKRLNAIIHLDVGPTQFQQFRNGMDRTYNNGFNPEG